MHNRILALFLIAVATLVILSGCTFILPGTNTTSTNSSSTSFPPFNEYGTIEKNITYSVVGDMTLELDLYRPAKQDSRKPIIVYIHGGGFWNGDKGTDEYSIWITDWLKRGYLVASVNYRLTPAYVFPAQVEDVKCAVRFLRENAVKYNLNTARIGACGDSAGGYLAAMLGLTDYNAGFDNSGGCSNQSSRVSAVVDLYGVTDIALHYDLEGINRAQGSISRFIGNPREFYRIAQKASPVNYISPDDPPFLIIHGEKDTVVLPVQSQLLYDKLKAANIPATLIWIKNSEHGFIPAGNDAILPARKEIAMIISNFFDKYLR